MPERLSVILKRFSESAEAFARPHGSPMLVWGDAPTTVPHPLILGTVPHFRPDSRPSAHDPLVFEVVKGSNKSNAFALGITLGRASSNDVPVDEESVSRFHCYFQKDQTTGVWHLVDAESFNGTYTEGVRLAPNRPAPLPDRVRLAFGSVEMRFFSPAAFLALLRERAASPGH